MASIGRPEMGKVLPARLDAKQAVAVAMDYFRDLFPEAAGTGATLEEIEESEDGRRWLITLGYDRMDARSAPQATDSRAYKIFTIDQTTGRVLSAKIRPVK